MLGEHAPGPARASRRAAERLRCTIRLESQVAGEEGRWQNPSVNRPGGLKPLSDRTQEHVDFISIQAMLFNGTARNWWQQIRVLVRFQARMIDE